MLGRRFEELCEVPVDVTGVSETYYPIRSFEDGSISESILINVRGSNYRNVTAIQKHAIPVINLRQDVMGCAPTGTGKTVAYLLPVLNVLQQNTSKNVDIASPKALVIVPTRELAIQICDEAKKLGAGTGISAETAYGGIKIDDNHIRLTSYGCDLLVGTPGRLNALLKQGKISLRQCTTLILDEADRMLEMGFEDQVRHIVANYELPAKGLRQTLMFSATFPKQQQQLATDFMHNHAFIQVGKIGGANRDIRQEVLDGRNFSKMEKLRELIAEYELAAESNTNHLKILVFVETKASAKIVADSLCDARTINGNLRQFEREETLNDFKSGVFNVLVATDVAARGLDIPQVQHVINYDFPRSIAVYVQRIGRSGRVGNPGHSVTFYNIYFPAERAQLKDLLLCLAEAQQEVPEWLLREAGHNASIQDYVKLQEEHYAWNG